MDVNITGNLTETCTAVVNKTMIFTTFIYPSGHGCEHNREPDRDLHFSSEQDDDIHHFYNQLTHTMLKNIELLKHFTISKTTPTCFGLQGNHHQGATIST